MVHLREKTKLDRSFLSFGNATWTRKLRYHRINKVNECKWEDTVTTQFFGELSLESRCCGFMHARIISDCVSGGGAIVHTIVFEATKMAQSIPRTASAGE